MLRSALQRWFCRFTAFRVANTPRWKVGTNPSLIIKKAAFAAAFSVYVCRLKSRILTLRSISLLPDLQRFAFFLLFHRDRRGNSGSASFRFRRVRKRRELR